MNPHVKASILPSSLLQEAKTYSRFERALWAALSIGVLSSVGLGVALKKDNTSDAMKKVTNVCSIRLPTEEVQHISNALNDWTSIWVATNGTRNAQERHALCAQLLSTSLQVFSNPDLNTTSSGFNIALEDTKQLMLTQIASQVLLHEQVAEDVAPLMGLPSSDVKHYFKSVQQGSPVQGSGPTPEAGPYFKI